jgi:hypothetical protein
MASDHRRQQTFRRIVTREAGASADAAVVAAAARQLCEQLAHHLAPLIGDAGAAAIVARSLHVAQRQVSGFVPVSACAQENDNGPLAYAQHVVEHQEPAVAAELAVAVLTTAGELLASFIGHRLTTRLLHEAWPNDFAGDSTEETTP